MCIKRYTANIMHRVSVYEGCGGRKNGRKRISGKSLDPSYCATVVVPKISFNAFWPFLPLPRGIVNSGRFDNVTCNKKMKRTVLISKSIKKHFDFFSIAIPLKVMFNEFFYAVISHYKCNLSYSNQTQM